MVDSIWFSASVRQQRSAEWHERSRLVVTAVKIRNAIRLKKVFPTSMQIDHVHFYVEDAQKWRDWFVHQLGFQAVAGSTSNHTHTEAIKSGSIRFVLSSPLSPASPVAQFLHQHPPGVADVALVVEDLESLMERAVSRGCKVLQPIQTQEKGKNCLKWGKIAAWGSLSHTLIEAGGDGEMASRGAEEQRSRGETSLRTQNSGLRTQDSGLSWDSGLRTQDSELSFARIDHLVLNVAAGDLERAVSWYEDVMGFQRQQTFDIQSEQSALHSQVMQHPSGGIQLPINEPGSSNSQIQEFLDLNGGAGIQHIALQTPDLVRAIAQLRAAGIPFLSVPPTYYTELQQRQAFLLTATELQEIAEQQILVDWQDDAPKALLLQTFTQPIFEQPTFFFELIERRVCDRNGQPWQAQGFGEGNFRALFEAIEREQMKRGSLSL